MWICLVVIFCLFFSSLGFCWLLYSCFHLKNNTWFCCFGCLERKYGPPIRLSCHWTPDSKVVQEVMETNTLDSESSDDMNPITIIKAFQQRGAWVCACEVALVVSDSLWPPDHSPPGFSVHWILQARILGWVTISSSRGSSRPRDWTHISYISCIGRRVLYHWHHQGSPKICLDSHNPL